MMSMPALRLKQGSNQQFGTDVLRSITSKLDAAVTALLSAAGTRAREIKLAMLPPDHQICELLAAIEAGYAKCEPVGWRFSSAVYF